MPNWASVAYVCKADDAQLKDLYEKIDTLNKSKSSVLENDFGRMWLGNLVHLLGGKWEEVECRGEITSYNLSIGENKLWIWFEHAWSDSSNLRDFLKQCYPGMKISFSVEELGCEIFVTNDIEEFPDKYYLDISDEVSDIYDSGYYVNLKDVVDIIQSHYGIKLEENFSKIYDWLESKAEESEFFGFIFRETEIINEE